MKSIYKILLLLSIIAVVSSCKDDEKDLFNDFGQGSFIRFVDEAAPPTVSFEVPSEASFSLPIEDVNENTSSYSLDLIATVSGTQTTVEDFITITSFPANLTISAQGIADALGVPLSDLSFGDNFAFAATAVRNDGVEFIGQRPVFTPATDTDPATLSGGNTSFNLLDGIGYRNAMGFNFFLACPVFVPADAYGTYTVSQDEFGVANSTFDVTAGPDGPNSLTFTGLFTQPFNVNIDPVTGGATIARQPVEDAFFGYAGGNVNTNAAPSFLFSCTGTVTFSIQYTVDLGSFGTFKLVAQKN